MPFQSWEIRPYGQGCVIFTLIAASVELEISIKENACCLNSPEDMELDGIRNKWLPAHILMQKLVAAGINVFPSEDADKYVSISVKVNFPHVLSTFYVYNTELSKFDKVAWDINYAQYSVQGRPRKWFERDKYFDFFLKRDWALN